MSVSARSFGDLFVLASAFLVVAVTSTHAATIVVPDDQPTIAAAVSAANTGDEIVVRPGRYREAVVVEEVITLRSLAGASLTTIEPPKGLPAVDVRSSASGSRLEGFTIEGADLDDRLGALQVTSAATEVVACRFIANRGIFGGPAIRVRGGGSIDVSRCSFFANVSVDGQGGAVRLDRGAICFFRETAFRENVAPEGGALYTVQTAVTAEDCRFLTNLAFHGGAIAAEGPAFLQLRDSAFEENRAHDGDGGALDLVDTTSLIFECRFRSNQSSRDGGALRSSVGSLTMTDCTFVGNSADERGGAVRISSGSGLINFASFDANTAGDSGGAISHGSGSYSMRNSIVWGNSVPSIDGSGSFPIIYSDLQDPIVGDGNIFEDPLFVPGPGGRLYLSQIAAGQVETSPCVDAGDPASSNGGSTRSDALPDAGIADMGAHYDARDAILECGGLGEADLLFVNGSRGSGGLPLVTVSAGSPILATMQAAPAGGSGRFFVHLNPGTPNDTTLTALPFSLGTACFPVEVAPFGEANPAAVWKNLPNPRAGSSMYFGAPIADPSPAPATFLDLPSGDPVNLPVGFDFTVQGAIVNPSSSADKAISLTNAVVVSVR